MRIYYDYKSRLEDRIESMDAEIGQLTNDLKAPFFSYH